MPAEGPEATSAKEQKEMEDKVTSPGRAEEAKLKAKYPHLGKSLEVQFFLREQLWKGQKYFYSGNYNMAKAKMKNSNFLLQPLVRQRSLMTTFPFHRAFLNRNHLLLLVSWLAVSKS